jgi:hypothetical protein
MATEGLTIAHDVRGDVVEGRDGAAFFGVTYDNGHHMRARYYDPATPRPSWGTAGSSAWGR